MKKIIISLLIVAAFVAIPVSVFAQFEGTSKATDAKANVVNALSVETNTAGGDFGGASLNFGSVTPGNTGGTVVLAPTGADEVGTRSTTGTVDLIGTDASCAMYTVTGTSGSHYTVTLPTSDVTLTGVGGAGTNTMTLNAFKINLDDVADAVTGTLTAAGVSKFTVGGTLSVAANQNAGAYTGTFPVIVAYN